MSGAYVQPWFKIFGIEDITNDMTVVGPGNSGMATNNPVAPTGICLHHPCILAAILTDALAKSSSVLFLRLWTLLLYIVMPWLTMREDRPEPRVVFILGLVLRTRDVSPSEMQVQVWGACIGLGRDPIDVTSALLYGPPLLVGGVETPNGSPTGHRDLSGLLRNQRRAQRSKLLASLADRSFAGVPQDAMGCPRNVRALCSLVGDAGALEVDRDLRRIEARGEIQNPDMGTITQPHRSVWSARS